MSSKPPHRTMALYRLGCRCKKCSWVFQANTDHYALVRILNEHPEIKGTIVPPSVHGTNRGYEFFGCRCALCRSVHIEGRRDVITEAGVRGDLPDHLHGTNSCYINRMCRCQRCTEAHNEYSRQYKEQERKRMAAEAERAR